MSLQGLEPGMTVLVRASSSLPDPTKVRCVRVVRHRNMVMHPAGPKAKNDCAGEASSKLPDQTN
jgi:hypothetical protein